MCFQSSEHGHDNEPLFHGPRTSRRGVGTRGRRGRRLEEVEEEAAVVVGNEVGVDPEKERVEDWPIMSSCHRYFS